MSITEFFRCPDIDNLEIGITFILLYQFRSFLHRYIFEYLRYLN